MRQKMKETQNNMTDAIGERPSVNEIEFLRVPSASMRLLHQPDTSTAQKAIEELYLTLEGHAERQSLRAEYDLRALGAIVRDLLHASSFDPVLPCFRPTAISAFKGQWIGYRSFSRVLKALAARALVEIKGGVGNPAKQGLRMGAATRIYPTDKLLEKLAEFGLLPADTKTAFRKADEAVAAVETLFLTARRSPLPGTFRSNALKAKAHRLPIDRDDAQAAAIRLEIEQLNAFWDRQSIDGASHEGFYRVFSRGGDASYKWNKGGRLYSVGGGYQTIKKALRTGIRINGQPTIEIDISGCHLSILHGLSGRRLAGDPYAVSELPRPVVKAWVTMTLGHSGYHTKWSEKAKVRLAAELGLHNPQKAFPFGKTQKRILAALPLLHDWKESKIRWDTLQFVESQIIIDTIISLSKLDIPALPIHDSIIVPESQVETAKAALIECFSNHVGSMPQIKLSHR